MKSVKIAGRSVFTHSSVAAQYCCAGGRAAHQVLRDRHGQDRLGHRQEQVGPANLIDVFPVMYCL